MRYWWAVLIGAAFGLNGCALKQTTDTQATYQIQGINAYKGQSANSLYADNGAPNVVQNIDNNGTVMWIYYTNYRQLSNGSEVITYNTLQADDGATTCAVKVILYQGSVQQIMSDCQ